MHNAQRDHPHPDRCTRPQRQTLVRRGVVSRPEVLRAPHARLLSAFALLAMVLRTPRVIWGDTWFNLVLGREIAQGGLIQQNLLTEQGFGERCVDLQWLAHAILYGVERAVGMPGVALLASALTCV